MQAGRYLICCSVLFCTSCSLLHTTRATSEVTSGPANGLMRTEISSQSIKDALERVPRQFFVPEQYRSQLTEGEEIEIGFGQRLSRSFIVALMTEYAQVQQGSRVLEVGTGSGYQAAVLSELGAEVYSIEIIPELSERARRTLYSLGYEDVRLRVGDGVEGWPQQAPFDAIIVTAASPTIPGSLLKQLAPQGRMVIALEEEGQEHDQLLLISREGNNITTKRLGAVRFEPLAGMIREAQRETINYSEPRLLQETLRGANASEDEFTTDRAASVEK